jgi:hypothetical protein
MNIFVTLRLNKYEQHVTISDVWACDLDVEV